jgi:hypothetical protein
MGMPSCSTFDFYILHVDFLHFPLCYLEMSDRVLILSDWISCLYAIFAR